jgi:hypothetical protein
MTPYVARYLTARDLEIFQRIRTLVIGLPDDIDIGNNDQGEKIILSCHILVRALAKVCNLQYQDGYFHPNYQHSWLLTPDGQTIDPYPVAIWGGPLMFDGSTSSPARWLYKKVSSQRISHGRFGQVWFRRAVRRVTKAIRKIEV